MPTWRERGAQPRSVTLRVAASSAPSTAASGLSSSYSSGATPVPTPMTTGGPGERLHVVVAPVRQHPHPSPRCRSPGSARERRAVDRGAAAGGRPGGR